MRTNEVNNNQEMLIGTKLRLLSLNQNHKVRVEVYKEVLALLKKTIKSVKGDLGSDNDIVLYELIYVIDYYMEVLNYIKDFDIHNHKNKTVSVGFYNSILRQLISFRINLEKLLDNLNLLCYREKSRDLMKAIVKISDLIERMELLLYNQWLEDKRLKGGGY